MRTSTRSIVQPAMYGGKECDGSNVRAEKCSTEPCPGMLSKTSFSSIVLHFSCLYYRLILLNVSTRNAITNIPKSTANGMNGLNVRI